MAKAKLYNLKGEVTGEVELAETIFSVKTDPALVQLVAVAQRANAARPYGDTKKRDEVRGGGRKPWRQKGTGRARQGSIRSPQWKGGGVVFGPISDRNQEKKVNKKARRKALRMVLSDKVAHERLIVVDSFDAFTGKTKEMSGLLSAVMSGKRSAVIAIATKNPAVTRAARNIPKTNTMLANSVNVLDLLGAQYLVVDQVGVAKITETFTA